MSEDLHTVAYGCKEILVNNLERNKSRSGADYIFKGHANRALTSLIKPAHPDPAARRGVPAPGPQVTLFRDQGGKQTTKHGIFPWLGFPCHYFKR